jgi:hypothetical protein
METAKEALVQNGELVPVLFIFGRKTSLMAGIMLPKTAQQRRGLFYLLGLAFADVEPLRLVLVVDAYVRLKKAQEGIFAGSFADDPEARECIMVSEASVDAPARFLYCTYTREPTLSGLKVTFDPIEELPPGQGVDFMLAAFFAGVKAKETAT